MVGCSLPLPLPIHSLSRLVALLRACVIAFAAAASACVAVAAAAASVRVNFKAAKFYQVGYINLIFISQKKTSILLINFPWRHKFCCCCCCVTENPNKIMSTL